MGLPAWDVWEKSTPSVNRFTGQSGSRDQFGHAKKGLASKDVVATDDCLYEIRIRGVASTWLTYTKMRVTFLKFANGPVTGSR
jgi:hypothetical protein